MSEKEKFIIWLAQFNLSKKKIQEILELCNSYDISAISNVKGIDKLVKFQDLELMREQSLPSKVDAYFENLEKQNITVLTYISKFYPKKLASLPDSPAYLFCKGDISLLDKFAISIVGSRSPSNYGRIITDDFAGQLAKAGTVIISGLAYGVDSISHRKSLEVGGKTIAVLGGGFNHIYPSEHTDLANEIAKKGLLITEYAPSTVPARFTFVQRNRIIAGLGEGLLITEGNLKSGTRSTKDFALDYGKEVFAIPGSIKSSYSDLPNTLIACGHAKCVLKPQDILDEFDMVYTASKPKVQQTTAQEDIILNLLADGEKDVEFLQENSGFDIKNLNSYLTMLEIRGIIKKLPGNFYTTV